MRVRRPPSRAIFPPPSITVLRCAGTSIGAAIAIVTGSAPQSNRTTSWLAIAVRRAASVQLPGVPSPTLGALPEVSTAVTGGVQTPATEATVSAIQNTLESKLDVTLSSRASQQSVNDVAARVASIQSGIGALQTYLDAPISSRASAADLTAVGTKVDQLQALLPSSSSLSALTQAVNALAPSISASQNRLAIEQALARGDRIAAFYLPTAQGGQLDLVRSIVVDVIDKNEAAGGATLAVLKARRVIIDADGRKAAGDYRGAYLLYVAAYQVVGI